MAYVVWDSSLTSTSTVWRQRINEVLNGDGPRIVWQPIFRLDPCELIGYEALARFEAGTPDEWFPAAITVGLGYELEMLCLTKALNQLGIFPAHLYLAINISADSVVNPGFAKTLSDYDLSRVVLELTEHDAVENYDTLGHVLTPLRAKGANICTPIGSRSSAARATTAECLRLSVDDLGAGFASMRHLASLKPDHMKLDVSMVRDIDHDRERRAMASAMVTYGAKMGIQVLAEGIETDPELVALRALDVHAGQGYLLGRPGAPLP